MIDFDVETTGLQAYSGQCEAFLWIFGDDTGFAEAIPFSPSGKEIKTWDVRQDPAVLKAAANCNAMSDVSRIVNRDRIQAWFDRAKDEECRAWNTKFDRAFADVAGHFSIPGDGLWHDGMVDAHAIDERRSIALKMVAVQLLGDSVDGPQKELKAWLNKENARRNRLLTDADKAIVGALKVKYVESKCLECKTIYEGTALSGPCVQCGFENYKSKNRIRLATDEENQRAIAEAAKWRDSEGTYIRANYSDVPKRIMETYALEDVILTRRVGNIYAPRIEEQKDLRELIAFERQTMDALYAIEKRGLPASEQQYRQLEQEVIANMTRLEQEVLALAAEGDPIIYAKELAGDRWGEGGHWIDISESGQIRSYEGGAADLKNFNPNSSAQVLAALKARKADMSYMSQKDGKTPADADNLRAVDDDLSVAILKFRAENKVLTTYVRPMIGRSYVSSMNMYKTPFIAPDGRIHANYRQVGARTGRMSVSDPAIQQMPRDDLRLRYNIVADPGHMLVCCDLSNIEMVLFAAYCGDGRLLDAVRAGEDLHVLTATMLGLRDRKRPGGEVETARQLGKTYNFSRIYGGGLRTIRRSFRCSLDEARLLKRRFDDAYPEVGRLQDRIEYRLADDGYIQDKLISGRRFRVDPRDSYKATNYLIQGTAAALLKYAVIQLHKDKVPMVALVHDEIVAHVPIADAPEAAKLIETRMTEFEGLKGVVPIRAEADIVERWSDAKPLEEQDATGNKTGRKYLFVPDWKGETKRHYV